MSLAVENLPSVSDQVRLKEDAAKQKYNEYLEIKFSSIIWLF